MIVDIDVGNTRLKWRAFREDSIACAQGAVPVAEVSSQQDVDDIFAEQSVTSVSIVRVAAVNSCCNDYISAWAQSQGSAVYFAQTQAYGAGVKNAYKDASQMGVDRWLAIIAAYHQWSQYRSVGEEVGNRAVVVDAGSALTVDVITDAGIHKGGYIVPGLLMMREALLGKTEQVRFSEDGEQYQHSLCLGNSTKNAVLSGIAVMHLGFIRHLLSDVVIESGDCVSDIFITGGDGAYLADLLRKEGVRNIYHTPDLVMDGLSLLIDSGRLR